MMASKLIQIQTQRGWGRMCVTVTVVRWWKGNTMFLCESVQTDSGTAQTTNRRLCCSFRLKTFLKTAASFVSLHYTRYPPSFIWEEVLLTLLLIVSIFKTTILSSSKAINWEVCVGTFRIRGGSSQDCVSPSRGDRVEAKIKDYSTKQHGKKGRDVTEYSVGCSPIALGKKRVCFFPFLSNIFGLALN